MSNFGEEAKLLNKEEKLKMDKVFKNHNCLLGDDFKMQIQNTTLLISIL